MRLRPKAAETAPPPAVLLHGFGTKVAQGIEAGLTVRPEWATRHAAPRGVHGYVKGGRGTNTKGAVFLEKHRIGTTKNTLDLARI